MSENDNDKKNIIISEHHDGIIEHDHPLPNWWLITFMLTVVFAGIYYLHYESNSGWSTDKELSYGLKQIENLKVTKTEPVIEMTDEVLVSGDMIQLGAKVYSEKCFMCHGDKGQGLIGPNMTDVFWIHGGSPKEILLVIQKGVPEKGMVAWESVLNQKEQVSLVAFIRSLRGSNPSGAKAPQGAEYKE
jgi:cytochrome c oxidase cbb3-type subunit 3